MPSKILLSAALFLIGATIVVSKPMGDTKCSKDSHCKYGGKCDYDGTCSCMFDCRVSKWGIRYHCGNGGARKYFKNICELTAEACRTQRDIPIIPFASRNDYKKTCLTTKPTRLCDDRATLTCNLGNLNAGICLTNTDTAWCLCPNHRTGANCQRLN